jgi:hypothetical protein
MAQQMGIMTIGSAENPESQQAFSPSWSSLRQRQSAIDGPFEVQLRGEAKVSARASSLRRSCSAAATQPRAPFMLRFRRKSSAKCRPSLTWMTSLIRLDAQNAVRLSRLKIVC